MVVSGQTVVLITGCSTGIGRALATEFSGRGHQVMATARRPESLVDLEAENVLPVALDVTSETSIESAVTACLEWAGRIDILVNNAGFALIGPVAEVSLDDLRVQFETNVVGLVATSQAVIPHMVACGSGRIVNIGSVSGITATPFGGAYSGTKAAVHLISDALRMELAPFGVEVITVQPGAIESDFGRRASTGVERYREGSLYSSIADSIGRRAMVSQSGCMPTLDFARLVVTAVTASNPPPLIRAGKHSALLPLLSHLPAPMRDRLLSRKFDLEDLGQGR